MNPVNSIRKSCLIIGSSPLFDWTGQQTADLVIASDGGYQHALKAGIAVDLVIGDFDSCAVTVQEIKAKNIPLIQARPEKDDTDTMLAIKYALEQGCLDFLLLGVTGGRFDHQMAALSAAAYIAEKGGKCTICDAQNEIYIFRNNCLRLSRRQGWYLSVFSWSNCSYGVSERGVKYPLENATLTNTTTLGTSNEFAIDAQASHAEIEVLDGTLCVILSKSRVTSR